MYTQLYHPVFLSSPWCTRKDPASGPSLLVLFSPPLTSLLLLPSPGLSPFTLFLIFYPPVPLFVFSFSRLPLFFSLFYPFFFLLSSLYGLKEAHGGLKGPLRVLQSSINDFRSVQVLGQLLPRSQDETVYCKVNGVPTSEGVVAGEGGVGVPIP